MRRARMKVDVIDPLDCQIVVDGKHSKVLLGNKVLPHYDVVLPRIGASITSYGLAVLKQFELLGTKSVNPSQAIAQSRDKMWCMQVLAEARLVVPATVLARNPRGIRGMLQAVRGMPVVAKVLQGTQGLGVMLLDSPIALKTVLDTLWNIEQDVLIQQFIAEAAGRDFRAFVIGDKVVAAMMRTAAKGDFRSNIHRGGEGMLAKLPKNYERAAIRATKAVGLHIAGVDIMVSHAGPMIVEVNSSPGFEGIERATGLNIAKKMVAHIRKIKRGKK